MSQTRGIGYAGMWVASEDDPRTDSKPVGELATIRQYLTNYRITLALKCDGLTPAELASRSVPPSTMSLLGLVRHMARVEHSWFHRILREHLDEPRFNSSDPGEDPEFDGAVADQAVIDTAFTQWRQQIAAADDWLDQATDLGAAVLLPDGDITSVRDILVHLIEEYARHCGHADLLRECIDGRTGH